MNTISGRELKTLLNLSGNPCVSMYQPTQPGGAEKDPIQFKNLIAEAEEIEQGASFGRCSVRGDLLALAAKTREQSEQVIAKRGNALGKLMVIGYLVDAGSPLCSQHLPRAVTPEHRRRILAGGGE